MAALLEKEKVWKLESWKAALLKRKMTIIYAQ